MCSFNGLGSIEHITITVLSPSGLCIFKPFFLLLFFFGGGGGGGSHALEKNYPEWPLVTGSVSLSSSLLKVTNGYGPGLQSLGVYTHYFSWLEESSLIKHSCLASRDGGINLLLCVYWKALQCNTVAKGGVQWCCAWEYELTGPHFISVCWKSKLWREIGGSWTSQRMTSAVSWSSTRTLMATSVTSLPSLPRPRRARWVAE